MQFTNVILSIMALAVVTVSATPLPDPGPGVVDVVIRDAQPKTEDNCDWCAPQCPGPGYPPYWCWNEYVGLSDS
jgi:hypothetical protein